ncbi:DsbA family protein [Oleiagrimonas soli]|uniref:Protein-disulfide isomerase n=1 Tax=Oleiagrimonas soli TaxID=1543381 RepID=A0A099CSJ0_9GAMM|nr:DsbA family protein [Oleiagrimonas soli]KGI76958.1 hypothetical protein LF63_0113705 [Oleiagrimonas soli]MBB6185165.1 protein-disulfide isomerase [Oleiagrimonas soli]
MKNVFPNIVTGVLVICAIVVTVAVAKQTFFHPSASHAVKNIADWKSLVAGKTPAMGQTGAPVVVVEFSDYQCPFCRALEPNLQKVYDKHRDDMVVYRYDFPLTKIHDHAYEAALASRCAGEQGAYRAFSSQLFKIDFSKGVDWSSLAQTSGVKDVQRFASCLDNRQTAKIVDQEKSKAVDLGIQGTPTLVINGRVVAGMESVEQLEKAVLDAKSNKTSA